MPIKKMTIKEFREIGCIQEINRLFLHPMGMALEVIVEEDGTEKLGGVWDYREDPEGISFGDNILSAEKALRVDRMWEEKRKVREEKLGYHIQLTPENEPDLTTPEETP